MDHAYITARLSEPQRRAVKVSSLPPNPGHIPSWVHVSTLRRLRREGLVREDSWYLTEDGFAVAAHIIGNEDDESES